MNRHVNLLWIILQRLWCWPFPHFTFGCFSANPEVVVEACSSRVFSSALKATVMQNYSAQTTNAEIFTCVAVLVF